MVSRGMKSVIKILKGKREKEIKKRVEEGRAGLVELARLAPLFKDSKLENVDAGGVPAAWMDTPEVAKDRAILYLHGGGYVQGSITSHQDLAQRISKVSETKVLILD